ncbi:cytochrome c oxidase assembly protein subunit 15 [Granulicella pectinivorans]|jgi:cytochrome c oxidase assembly protein subunit 15|uniref:Cytochrome c oxidase assembly protein subunit 15 n=1 Tax=Granulicella pectinivorans TaxID=474950 RepID=A0A1I6MRY2_9BACT|nr:COX15/CtaA family protein [Granulicella pectinivorans]SFS18490.1 cytochrome c oxidase assembly protein subunit 15 [Granulicella pectinivorans]
MGTVTVISAKRSTRGAARLAWITLGFFILVVLWGAVVRATGSGAGCGANWPLCNGDFFPHHPRLATVIEFTHRSTSGICTMLLVALGVYTFRVTPKKHRARTAVLWSGFFLVTEAALGALLVLRHYVEDNISVGRVIAQSVHLTNTMLFMGALTLTAWYLRERDPIETEKGSSGTAIAAIFATLVVSATGSLAALADTLFPSPSLRAGLLSDFAASSPELVRMRWVHPASALIGLACVLLLVRGLPARARIGQIMVGLIGLQAVLGIVDVLLLAPIWMQVLHLLGADLYWIALVVLAAAWIWPEKQTTSL